MNEPLLTQEALSVIGVVMVAIMVIIVLLVRRRINKMPEEKKVVSIRKGVIKYTKLPANTTPPLQRTAASAQTTKHLGDGDTRHCRTCTCPLKDRD